MGQTTSNNSNNAAHNNTNDDGATVSSPPASSFDSQLDDSEINIIVENSPPESVGDNISNATNAKTAVLLSSSTAVSASAAASGSLVTSSRRSARRGSLKHSLQSGEGGAGGASPFTNAPTAAKPSAPPQTPLPAHAPFPLIVQPQTLLQKVVSSMMDGEIFTLYAYESGAPTPAFVFFSLHSSDSTSAYGALYWNTDPLSVKAAAMEEREKMSATGAGSTTGTITTGGSNNTPNPASSTATVSRLPSTSPPPQSEDGVRTGRRYHRSNMRCLPLVSIVDVQISDHTTTATMSYTMSASKGGVRKKSLSRSVGGGGGGSGNARSSLSSKPQLTLPPSPSLNSSTADPSSSLSNNAHHSHHAGGGSGHSSNSSSSNPSSLTPHTTLHSASRLSESFRKWVSNPLINAEDFRAQRKQRRERRKRQRKLNRERIAHGLIVAKEDLIESDSDEDGDGTHGGGSGDDDEEDEDEDLPTYTYTPPKASHCFTIITQDRTLDLVARNKNSRDMWVYGVKEMMKRTGKYFNHCIPVGYEDLRHGGGAGGGGNQNEHGHGSSNHSNDNTMISMTMASAVAYQQNVREEKQQRQWSQMSWHQKLWLRATDLISGESSIPSGGTSMSGRGTPRVGLSRQPSQTSSGKASPPLIRSASPPPPPSQHAPFLHSGTVARLIQPGLKGVGNGSQYQHHHARFSSLPTIPSSTGSSSTTATTSSSSTTTQTPLSRLLRSPIGVEFEICVRHIHATPSVAVNNHNSTTTGGGSSSSSSPPICPIGLIYGVLRRKIQPTSSTSASPSATGATDSQSLLGLTSVLGQIENETPYGVLLGRTERITPASLGPLSQLSKSFDIHHPNFLTRIPIKQLDRFTKFTVRIHDMALWKEKEIEKDGLAGRENAMKEGSNGNGSIGGNGNGNGNSAATAGGRHHVRTGSGEGGRAITSSSNSQHVRNNSGGNLLSSRATPLHTPGITRRPSRVRVGSIPSITFEHIVGEPNVSEIESSPLIGVASISYDTAFYGIDRELVMQLDAKPGSRLPSIDALTHAWNPPRTDPLPFVDQEDVASSDLFLRDSQGRTIVTDAMLEAYKASVEEKKEKMKEQQQLVAAAATASHPPSSSMHHHRNSSLGNSSSPFGASTATHTRNLLCPLLFLRIHSRRFDSSTGLLRTEPSEEELERREAMQRKIDELYEASQGRESNHAARRRMRHQRSASCEMPTRPAMKKTTTSQPQHRRRRSWNGFDREIRVEKILLPRTLAIRTPIPIATIENLELELSDDDDDKSEGRTEQK